MLELPGYTAYEQVYTNSRTAVYRARRNNDRKPVIIKLLREEYPSAYQVTRFKSEFEILKTLEGKGTVEAYELLPYKNQFAMVMEDFGTSSIDQLINKQRLTVASFLRLALKIADAVEEIQSHRIIHKDLNATNILWDSNKDEVKIIDFGIAGTLAREQTEAENLGQLEGMLPYIAPEQTGRMNHSIDFRADYYSLGVTYYRMITGQFPFQTSDPLELVHHHIAKMPPSPRTINSSIPEPVEKIILKLLSKNPEDRYQTVAGLKKDLKRCLDELTASGTIENFTIGEQDVSDRFIIPEKLYGREKEIEQLFEVFNRVVNTKIEVLLVAGQPGIGKTALIKESYKPVAAKNGYFIAGKFEQYKRNIPYEAFKEAFTQWVEQILSQSSEKVEAWREKLTKAVRSQGRILADMIPLLKDFLGECPEIPPCEPEQEKARFNTVFNAFLETVATKDHPLVLFLDDLQWADMRSLELLSFMTTHLTTGEFVFIGAYRDNEAINNPFMQSLLGDWRKSNTNITTVELLPLNSESTQQLLADTLHTSLEAVKPLAEIIHNKTQGNPFFIREFLQYLYKEECIQFDRKSTEWTWDIQKINEKNYTDNVVEFIGNKIGELSPVTSDILKYAACLGTSFATSTLAAIMNKKEDDIIQGLRDALENNFIFSVVTKASVEGSGSAETKTYKFSHDRILQVCYALASDTEKPVIHLAVARFLQKITQHDKSDDRAIDIASHVNQAQTLLTSPEDKLWMAEMNQRAAQRSVAATDFQAALAYCDAGIGALPKDAWVSHYDLASSLYFNASNAAYHFHTFEAVHGYAQQLLQHAKSKLEKINAYKLEVYAYMEQENMPMARLMTSQALETVGMNLPTKTRKLGIVLKFIKIKWLLRGKNPESLDDFYLHEDEEFAIAATVVYAIIGHYYMHDPASLALCMLVLMEESLKKGLNFYSSGSFMMYGMLLCNRPSKIEKGYQFGMLCLKLLQLKPESTIPMRYMIPIGIYHTFYPIKRHIKDAFRPLKEAFKECLENTANVSVAAISIRSYIHILFWYGNDLAHYNEEARTYCEFLKKHANVYGIGAIIGFYKAGLFLSGQGDSESTYFKPILEDNDAPQKGLSNEIKATKTLHRVQLGSALFVNYLIGEIPKAYEYGIDAFKQFKRGVLTAHTPPVYFYTAMTLIEYISQIKSRRQKNKFMRIIHFCQKRLWQWSQHAPMNYLHKYWLLSAELARLGGKNLEAETHYDKAITGAKENGYHIEEALANELAGKFYLKLGMEKVAKVYLSDSHYVYYRSGVYRKVRQLESLYPSYLKKEVKAESLVQSTIQTTLMTGTVSKSHNVLDLSSIMKAVRTISKEILLADLLRSLMSIVLENAMADKGFLLQQKDNEWLIEAEGEIGKKAEVLHDKKIKDNLPESIINFVLNKKEPVVLGEFDDKNQFFRDTYFVGHKPKSILCMPLLSHESVTNIIYLENTLVGNAFSHDRVELLKILSGQMVTSLENAQLFYQSNHDPLTGLANRNLLYQMFNQAAKKATRAKTNIAILFMDLDGFKKVNDTLGHGIGDALLINFTQLLTSCLRESDLAVRLGGDEFVVMLENIELKQLTQIVERILTSAKKPVVIKGNTIYISVSVGISVYPQDSLAIAELLKQADIALYRVKGRGKGFYEFYKPELMNEVLEENKQEIELREAIKSGDQLVLYYQPVYDAKTLLIGHFEALIRWKHPTRGMLAPDKFISMAEKTGLILQIGEWSLRTACQQIKTWISQGVEPPPIAVNVSGVQFSKQNVRELIKTILEEYNLPPAYMELEFTESVFIHDSKERVAEMVALKEMGLQLTLDDFGTHYSSLTYLRYFPIQKIKIDKSFVTDVIEDTNNQKLISAILAIGRIFNLKIVAEGVENEAQLLYLQKNGIDELQGYYLSPPVTAQQCSELLLKQQQQMVSKSEPPALID